MGPCVIHEEGNDDGSGNNTCRASGGYNYGEDEDMNTMVGEARRSPIDGNSTSVFTRPLSLSKRSRSCVHSDTSYCILSG